MWIRFLRNVRAILVSPPFTLDAEVANVRYRRGETLTVNLIEDEPECEGQVRVTLHDGRRTNFFEECFEELGPDRQAVYELIRSGKHVSVSEIMRSFSMEQKKVESHCAHLKRFKFIKGTAVGYSVTEDVPYVSKTKDGEEWETTKRSPGEQLRSRNRTLNALHQFDYMECRYLARNIGFSVPTVRAHLADLRKSGYADLTDTGLWFLTEAGISYLEGIPWLQAELVNSMHLLVIAINACGGVPGLTA